jgi:ATP-dependent Clp protease ATP-binding subunit ClpA
MEQVKRDVLKAAEDRFSPEFRNRIDEIVVFSPLSREEVYEIAELYLGKVRRQMELLGKHVEITPEALTALVDKGFSPAYGARFLKRTIDEIVKLPITQQWNHATHFHVVVRDGAVAVEADE